MTEDQNKVNPDVKMIIDFFGNQFNDSINRLQENNDRAHEQLFTKVDNMTKDVGEISSSVKVIIRNEEEHRKKISDMEAIVGNLSDRINDLEDVNEKNQHFWSKLKNNFTTAGVVAGAVYAIWKIIEFFLANGVG